MLRENTAVALYALGAEGAVLIDAERVAKGYFPDSNFLPFQRPSEKFQYIACRLLGGAAASLAPAPPVPRIEALVTRAEGPVQRWATDLC